MLLERFSSPEVRAADWRDTVVVLPLGAFEQHGPHLPLTTDTDIVTAIAREVERQRPEQVLCLPTMWLGHSTHHLAFPGTVSLAQMPYIEMICQLCDSVIRFGARKIFLLNGHGGNDIPVRTALREVKSRQAEIEDLDVVFASYWALAAQSIREIRESELGGLGHACEMETSLMLHLHPERVRMHLARRDGPSHPSPYRKADMQIARPIYFVNEFHEISESGTVGHPDLATSEKGQRFLEAIVKDVLTFVDDFATW